VVNTASECGYTPQYAALEKLYQTYREEGFHILAFPSNNFGAQEPGTDAEIKEFCSVNYDVSFPLFSKIAVKGNDQHPFYTYLTGFPDVSGEIEWNFNKFLIGRSGKPVARFGTRTDPLDEAVIAKIELILRQ
jgi:glutathione peroxidase